jgi:hypothetical protein
MVDQTGRTVVAAFRHRAQAQRAVDALLDAGFDQTSIAIEAPDEWRHHDHGASDEPSDPLAPHPDPTAGLWPGSPADAGLPARWPVPAGALLGGAIAAAAAWVARQRRRTWWRSAGWSRSEIGLVAAGAVAGAVGGLALLTSWRHDDAQHRLEAARPHAEYDSGNLERGHAIVTVAPGDRLADAESLLRAFGGRAVHLRSTEAPAPVDLDATVSMETVA